jgi:hypothetical protein
LSVTVFNTDCFLEVVEIVGKARYTSNTGLQAEADNIGRLVTTGRAVHSDREPQHTAQNPSSTGPAAAMAVPRNEFFPEEESG